MTLQHVFLGIVKVKLDKYIRKEGSIPKSQKKNVRCFILHAHYCSFLSNRQYTIENKT